jgi:hypothetical protein
MKRRLEDRILDLCAEAVATPEGPKLETIMRQLNQALLEHNRRARTGYFNTHEERRGKDLAQERDVNQCSGNQ